MAASPRRSRRTRSTPTNSCRPAPNTCRRKRREEPRERAAGGKSMTQQTKAAGWIGASLLRKEDARYLHGQGMFIADVHVAGVQDVAFVRSQMANAKVRNIIKPAHAAARVFTLADIGPLNILE